MAMVILMYIHVEQYYKYGYLRCVYRQTSKTATILLSLISPITL